MAIFDEHEFEAESFFRQEMWRAKISQEAESGIWTTKNGTRIKVSDMTDSHLVNTYRILKRNNVRDMLLPWIMVMEKEIMRRGMGGVKIWKN